MPTDISSFPDVILRSVLPICESNSTLIYVNALILVPNVLTIESFFS